jgi:hypothetical protein
MTRPAADLIKHLWTGTGSGLTIGLGANVAGFAALPAALDNQIISFEIEHENGSERECGSGLFTFGGSVLSRDLVTGGTAGVGTRVNFSAGNKHVRLTALAQDFIENLTNVDPGVNDGILLGYLAGRSRWLNTATKRIWFCIQHTAGNAQWMQLPQVSSFQTFSNASGTIVPTSVAEISIVALTGDLTGTLTATLPAPSSVPGRTFIFFRSGGGQFDFVAGPKTARKGEQIRLISDGTAWQSIEDRRPAQVRVTTASFEVTLAGHGGREVIMTSAVDLTVLLRDDYPSDTSLTVAVEPAAVNRLLTFSPEGNAVVQAAFNPLVIPAGMPYEVFLYVTQNSDGAHAITQVYDRSGKPLVREVSGTGARTLFARDVDSQQRNASGTATWTVNQFVGSIFVDNIDGGQLTLAPGTGVTLLDTLIAAGKFATLVGRNGGTSVTVIESP